MNPPFDLYPEVIDKLRRDCPRALVLAPLWRTGWFGTLFDMATQHHILPQGPIFRFRGRFTMPAPAWRTCIFFFAGGNTRTRLPLLCCGDVESNPGPAYEDASFTDFAQMAGDFVSAADKTEMARTTVSLRLRTKSWSFRWWDEVLVGTGMALDQADALTMCAAFELFSGKTLTCDNNAFHWRTPTPPASSDSAEIALLRQEIERPKLSHSPPSEESIGGELSEATVRQFISLKPGPPWMREMSDVFLRSTTAMDEPPGTTLLDLWKLLVGAQFRYGRTFGKHDLS